MNATTKLKHNHQMVFGKKVDGCPRCDELKAGAAPIRWAGMEMKRRSDGQRSAAVRSHNCKVSGCGPVCTFGDW